MDIEEVQEFIEDSKELAYAIACIGFIAIGVVADLILDRQLDSNTLRGVVTIVASLTGLFVILFALTHERAKEQQYNAYLVSADIEGAKEAKEAYTALQSQVGEIQTNSESALKECERLRKVERLLLEKLQTLESDLANANKEIANAKVLHTNALAYEAKKLANAKESEANALANAVKEVKSNLAPTIKLGKLCLEYRQNKSLGNTNGVYKDNESKRVEYSQKAKELNVKINEHIESLA